MHKKRVAKKGDDVIAIDGWKSSVAHGRLRRLSPVCERYGSFSDSHALL
jgi:hypothetical protein